MLWTHTDPTQVCLCVCVKSHYTELTEIDQDKRPGRHRLGQITVHGGHNRGFLQTWFPGIALEPHEPLLGSCYKHSADPSMPLCQTDKDRCHSFYLDYQSSTVSVMARRWSSIKIWVSFNDPVSASHGSPDHCLMYIAHENGKSWMKSPVLISLSSMSQSAPVHLEKT